MMSSIMPKIVPAIDEFDSVPINHLFKENNYLTAFYLPAAPQLVLAAGEANAPASCK